MTTPTVHETITLNLDANGRSLLLIALEDKRDAYHDRAHDLEIDARKLGEDSPIGRNLMSDVDDLIGRARILSGIAEQIEGRPLP